MPRMQDKVAIITGAASGMGLAGSQLLAREGAIVVMTDVVEESLRAEAQKIVDTGGRATAHVLDVSSPESWNTVMESVLADYGHVDALVNNAGIHMPKGVLDAELEDWNKVLAVNLTGVWLGMKSVIPSMQATGGGSIVNISSIAGIIGGESDAGGAAYSASKGGVRSLTKHAAQWFAGDSIRVNSIHPGSVFTGLTRAAGFTKETAVEQPGAKTNTPLPPHIGDPEDIGYAMLFLASDESKYVTGEELVVDGGWTTH
jgi:NAD(P)-dependent dehydrogenase (short-subunit alcohol dehydrogenase family)